MNNKQARRAAAFVFLLSVCSAAVSQSLPAASANLVIRGLYKGTGDNTPASLADKGSAGLNDDLWVRVEEKLPDQQAGNTGTTPGPGTGGTSGAAEAAATGSSGTKAAPPEGPAGRDGVSSPPETQPKIKAKAPLSLDADKYVLFLNGSELKDIGTPTYRAFTPTGENDETHALVFKLKRTPNNKDFWSGLMGSPRDRVREVAVSLAVKGNDGKTQAPTIVGEKLPNKIKATDQQQPSTFDFQVWTWIWSGIAAGAVGLVIFLVWGHARRSTTLRDNLVPQLPPGQQPYSLARWQMAFWFVLIFSSFIFLYLLLWDYNTVSTQALALMGISGATALAAVAVDIAKDSPADATNRALQALGLNTYADVLRMRQETDARISDISTAQDDFSKKQAAAARAKEAADAANALPGSEQCAADAKAAASLADIAEKQLEKLREEIQDRRNVLRTYDEKVKPFMTQGWFKDITTDLNGPTVHRIQVLCWTIALGFIFLVGVYRDLTMPPDFSVTLLALMGISSAGYIGFKYPEKNN
jgi:hypothetical protein